MSSGTDCTLNGSAGGVTLTTGQARTVAWATLPVSGKTGARDILIGCVCFSLIIRRIDPVLIADRFGNLIDLFIQRNHFFFE